MDRPRTTWTDARRPFLEHKSIERYCARKRWIRNAMQHLFLIGEPRKHRGRRLTRDPHRFDPYLVRNALSKSLTRYLSFVFTTMNLFSIVIDLERTRIVYIIRKELWYDLERGRNIRNLNKNLVISFKYDKIMINDFSIFFFNVQILVIFIYGDF